MTAVKTEGNRPSLRTLQAAALLKHGIEPDSAVLRSDAAAGMLDRDSNQGEWLCRFSRSIANGDRPSDNSSRAVDTAHKYKSLRPMGFVRAICDLEGIDHTVMTDFEAAGRALATGSAEALFSTLFNARLLSGFMTAPDTTRMWAGERQVSNWTEFEFSQKSTVTRLRRNARGKTPDSASVNAEVSAKGRLVTHSADWQITREDLLDDRFGTLGDTPEELGVAASELRCDLAYSTLLLGETTNMLDGAPQFKAGENLLTGVGHDSASYDSARVAFSNRIDPKSGRIIGEYPKFALVPNSKHWTSKRVLNSVEERNPTATTDRGTSNPAYDFVVPIPEQRLDLGCWDPIEEKIIPGEPDSYFLASGSDHGLVLATLDADNGAPITDEYRLTGGLIGIGFSIHYAIACLITSRLGIFKCRG